MVQRSLEGLRVAVLVSDGFEQVELDKPVEGLREAGATVHVLAEDQEHLERIRGVNHLDPAEGTKGDKVLEEVSPEDYDALYIPGGLPSPDTMRSSEAHLRFARAFMEAGKPVAAMCHGPWVLADAEVLEGKRVASWEAIRRDLERAGATWVDEPVVKDGNLLTSRKPDDLDQYVPALLKHVAQAGKPLPPGQR